METHDVYSIDLSKGKVKIKYSVTLNDGSSEISTVERADRPHDDMKRLLDATEQMALGFLEFDLKKFTYRMMRVNFLEKDKLFGVCVKGEIGGLEYATDTIKVATPKYFERPNKGGVQLLKQEEVETLKNLKEEAFLYAYYSKRLQPTAEEAQAAYENGGLFADEVIKKDGKN